MRSRVRHLRSGARCKSAVQERGDAAVAMSESGLGIVLVDHGSRKALSNDLLVRSARKVSSRLLSVRTA
jgi:hypothetical protein